MPGTGPSPGCAVPLHSAPVAGPDEGLVDPPDAVDAAQVHKCLGAFQGLPIQAAVPVALRVPQFTLVRAEVKAKLSRKVLTGGQHILELRLEYSEPCG